jgi:hypothetical protein
LKNKTPTAAQGYDFFHGYFVGSFFSHESSLLMHQPWQKIDDYLTKNQAHFTPRKNCI